MHKLYDYLFRKSLQKLKSREEGFPRTISEFIKPQIIGSIYKLHYFLYTSNNNWKLKFKK